MAINGTRLEQRMRFFQKGSMKDGTAESGALGVETYVHVDSDEPAERIRELIRMGERTCYTQQSLMNAVPVQTYVGLNGEDLQMEEQDAANRA